MNAPAITQRESLTGLTLPLVVVFVVAVGYGVVLPVLPFVLARALGEAARASVAWHTGLLTGVYMLALFLFAPLWGYVSDRIGRRAVILLGLAGFSAAMLWLPLVRGRGRHRARAGIGHCGAAFSNAGIAVRDDRGQDGAAAVGRPHRAIPEPAGGGRVRRAAARQPTVVHAVLLPYFVPVSVSVRHSRAARGHADRLQYLAELSPLRHYMEVVLGLFLKGVGLEVLWPRLAAMVAIGVALLAVSVWRFRRCLG